ncbi:sulfate ABC transporter substrate-binding protein, partial [Acetobacter fabarum]
MNYNEYSEKGRKEGKRISWEEDKESIERMIKDDSDKNFIA